MGNEPEIDYLPLPLAMNAIVALLALTGNFLQEDAKLFQHSDGTLRCFMWHKSQKSYCAFVSVMINLVQKIMTDLAQGRQKGECQHRTGHFCHSQKSHNDIIFDDIMKIGHMQTTMIVDD